MRISMCMRTYRAPRACLHTCVCMYVCACMYACRGGFACAFVHTFIHALAVWQRVNTCMSLCVCVQMWVYPQSSMCKRGCVCMCV